MEGAWRADPVLEGRMRDLGFQLLKAAQTKNKAMKGGQEDCRGGNLGVTRASAMAATAARKSKTLLR